MWVILVVAVALLVQYFKKPKDKPKEIELTPKLIRIHQETQTDFSPMKVCLSPPSSYYYDFN
jgi:hypothetical protein|tara:strand:- start:268 stop:453 length:186 start_codon:yes stop_codon:yes gene_type:complete